MQPHKEKWVLDSIKAFENLIDDSELNELDQMLFTPSEIDAIEQKQPVHTQPKEDKDVMRIRASRLKLLNYIWKGERIGWIHFESLDKNDF